jgi:hypothetical protein
VLDDDIKLDGYYDKPFREDRNCFGGGVLVYVSTTLKVKRDFIRERAWIFSNIVI